MEHERDLLFLSTLILRASLLLTCLGTALGVAAFSQERQSRFRRRLVHAWEFIQSTKVPQLPQALISLAVRNHDLLAERVQKILISRWGSALILVVAVAFFGIGILWVGFPWTFKFWSFQNPAILIAAFYAAKLLVSRIYAPATLALEIVFYPGVFIAAAWLYYNMVEKAFGPYTWAMHTAFLPTLCYLILILVAVVARALLLASERFLRKAKQELNPYGYTSAVVIFFSAILGIFGELLKMLD